jgi:hypothetical protein
MCERRGVRICCHDPPHDEAVDPPVRTFHTVSLGIWVNRALLCVSYKTSMHLDTGS